MGCIGLVAYNLVYHARRRNHRAAGPAPAGSFDAKYGTETEGNREIGTLDIAGSSSALHAVRYSPSGEDLIRTELAKLTIEFPRVSFIDFGSGKGRVLLVAAEFPFKEVIGVELSQELHDIALRNLARFPSTARRAGMVRSIQGDVVSCELPQSDLVCYFYNPFGPPIMEKVADRLIAHHQQHGYSVMIIYVDPRHREIFERTGAFWILAEAPGVLVLTTDGKHRGP